MSISGRECGEFSNWKAPMNYLVYSFFTLGLAYWIGAPDWKYSNTLIFRKNPGEELEDWLKKFNWGSRQDPTVCTALPKYKFYSEVVEVLLNLARKMGGNYQESLMYLRDGLQADRQFEKKIKEATLGTWLQMGMMMVLTWIFILSALSLVEVKVSFTSLFFIFMWQTIGLASLPFVLRWLRKKYFGDLGKIWKILFILKALVRVPLSRTELFALAGVRELNLIKQRSLEAIVQRLKDTCQRALKVGGCYEEEVQYLMGELRFQEKWHFELFEKRLVMLKLTLLSVFFLPSYLAFIFLLLGDLMDLM